MGSAPPLTQLYVYAIISTKTYPNWEYISANQLTTKSDHGGNEMIIVTIEIGYGMNNRASMNGSILTEIKNVRIHDSGNIVIGFYRYWNASGHESGRFSYQSTSQNQPWNTLSAFINIK